MKKFFALASFLFLASPVFAESDFQQGQAKVTASVLNVRNIASTGGEIAGSVKRGDIVDVTERSKNESVVEEVSNFWYKIRFTEGKESKTGWVFGAYLSFELNMESGLRWKNLSPAGGQKLTAVALSDAGEVYTGTDQGNIFITGDKGKTWKKVMPQALGINIGYISRIIINGKNVLIASRGGNRGGIWKSSNGGSSWAQSTTAQGLSSNEVFDIIAGSDGVLYAGTDRGISVSRNTGTSWNALSESPLKGTVLSTALGVKGVVYAGTSDGLFCLQDVKGFIGGIQKEWVRVGQKAPNMGNSISAIASAPDGSFLAGTNKGLNKAVAAAPDEFIGLGGQTGVNDIVIEQSGRIIVATDNGLNISLDNGASWATYKKENGLASNKIGRIAVNKKDRVIWVISGTDGISFHD